MKPGSGPREAAVVTTYTGLEETALRVICWRIQLCPGGQVICTCELLYLRTRGEDPGEHHPVRCLDSSIVEPRPNRDSPLLLPHEARTRQQLRAEGRPWSRCASQAWMYLAGRQRYRSPGASRLSCLCGLVQCPAPWRGAPGGQRDGKEAVEAVPTLPVLPNLSGSCS